MVNISVELTCQPITGLSTSVEGSLKGAGALILTEYTAPLRAIYVLKLALFLTLVIMNRP